MAEYDDLSYDELIAKNQDLMAHRALVVQEIENEQIALQKVLDLRVMERTILSGMTEDERALMAQALALTPAAEEAPVEGEGE